MSQVKVILKGNNKYLTWLHAHLLKEHPKTRRLMTIKK